MGTLIIQNLGSFHIDKIPDQCPLCHHKIKPIEWAAIYYRNSDREIERLLQCPNEECKHFFIALYVPGGAQYSLKRCTPTNLVDAKQSETITKLSKDFCSIFDQASKAEQYGFLLVAGPGYRKALEFLIKDYIIAAHPDKKEEIEDTFLGKCISTYIEDKNIKEMAKRAAWLGNDETHFVRTWPDKDLKDLKKLIELTLHWMEMVHISALMMADMPESGPASKPKS
jgi:hypothetical protein